MKDITKMLINIAKGDAYGVGFEFVRDKDVKRYHRMSGYRKSHLMKDKESGSYSDDTQLSIAIAELMLEEEAWNAEKIADKFVEVFKRDERMGYTKGFYQMLTESSCGKDLIMKINGDSVNNGSAMRAVPIGLYNSKKEVLERAELQAKVTHDSHEGIMGAKIVALASHFLIKGVRLVHLVREIENELGIVLNCNSVSRCPMDCVKTAEAALTLLINSNSQTQIIDLGINAGGDTDTVLAIACGLGSLSEEIDQDLIGFFDSQLENGQYGRDYLISLDRKLINKFKDNNN